MSAETFGQSVDRRLDQRPFLNQLSEVARLPVAPLVRNFQIEQEFALEGREHLNEHDMAFDRSELRLGKTPGRFLESSVFGVFDIG